MRRRLGLASLGVLALFALPLAVAAQSARVYRIGVVLQGGPYASAVDGLREGLREQGLEEGKQFVFHVRDTKGDPSAVEAAARSLEAEQVDVIVAVSTSVSLAVKRATRAVPIVFYAGTDPVTIGLVESFRKPGGRLTGVHFQGGGLTAKRLELLKELVPKLRRVVVFYRPDSPVAQQSVQLARDGGRQLKVELVERPVATADDLRASVRALRIGEADALLYVADAMVISQSPLIIETALTKRLPTMFSERSSVASGALAAYGESYAAIGRLSAKTVQRILHGANPGDLPVEQADRFHLVINLRTAKAIGLAVPQSVRARADEVIE